MSAAAAWLIGVFLAGIVLNAFFAGYETGFVCTNPIRVRHLAEKKGETNAKLLLAYLDSPDRMITLVLVGTNLALIMGTVAITRQIGDDFWATIVATPLFLIFGEILPKSMFRLHPTRSSLHFLPIIRVFDWVMAPLVVPVTWLSQRLAALGGGVPQGKRVFMRSQEDVRVLIDESADQGAIEPEEQEMIHSVMDLQTRQANEIMVPRIDIKALPNTATRAELLELLTKSGHTRIPIYEESIDRIIGVINAFDVLTDATPQNEDITRFVRETMHVPDTIKLDDVLKSMRDGRHHIAIVTDEYGGTDGMITIEDILEEIFGEIHDEFDKERTPVRKAGPNAFIVDGRADLEDAAELMGIELKDDEVETVGGWLTHRVGRIPEKGEVIQLPPYHVTVLDGTPNRVSSIRLEIRPDKESSGDETTTV